MKTNDEKILSFILDEPYDTVANFVKKGPIPQTVQQELLDNYPETFKRIAPIMGIDEEVMIKMIIMMQ